MKKNKLIATVLCVVYIITLFTFVPAYAVGTNVNEKFDFADGTRLDPKQDWIVSAFMSTDKVEVQNKELMIKKDTGTKVIQITKKLKTPYEDTTVLVSYKMRVVKSSNYDMVLPMIGSSSGPDDGTTQLYNYNGNLNIIETIDGKMLTPSSGMKIVEGNTYTFGFVVDLKKQTQDIYIQNSDGDSVKLTARKFKTESLKNIDKLQFRFGDGDTKKATSGEYYLDDIAIEESNADSQKRFDAIFNKKVNVKIDKMDDIKAKVGNGILLFVGSSDAYANGARTKVDVANDEVMPLIINDRTLVPVRFISESLGAKVGWEESTSTVTVDYNGTNIILKLGEKAYTVNGEAKEFDVPADTVNDRTLLPLRAVVESLGKQVFWDERGLIGITDSADAITASDTEFLDRVIKTFGIFVSPKGDDNNKGTMASPFKTLERARDEIRFIASQAGLPQGGITAYVRGGDYRFEKTFALAISDSGSSEAPITYRAYPGEEVIFTGASTIPGNKFEPIANEIVKNRLYENVRDKVLQVNLKDLGITDYGKVYRASPWSVETPDTAALYLNDKKQILAQWPNDGYANTSTILSQGTNWRIEGYTFKFEGNQILRWKNAKEAWVQGYWVWDWADDSMPVKSFDIEQSTITTSNGNPYGIVQGKKYTVFNLLEEIDMPGEWFVDRITGILYYYPIDNNLANKKIQLATFDKPMINMSNCSNVNFVGMTYEATAATAINMNSANNNLIAGSTMHNIGGLVINEKLGRNNTFSGLNIYDTSKGGIVISGVGDAETLAGTTERATLTKANNIVENCYFANFNTSMKSGAPAIYTHLTTCGNVIKNNIIHDGPQTAIMFGGNDHLVQYNELYDLSKEGNDIGAIYAGRDWASRGSIFDNNMFHDITGMNKDGVHALYFDDGVSQSPVTRNIFYNVGSPLFINGGRDFTIDSNIVANSTHSMWIINISAISSHYVRLSNIPVNSELWKTRYPNLWNIVDDEPKFAKYNTITRTLNYKTRSIQYPDAAVETGTFTNNVETEDASLFEDAANNIFKLVKDSGIDGFQQIEYNKIGLYIGNYRKEFPKIDDFTVTFPMNGDKNVSVNRTILRWEKATGATYYNVTIAKDANFNDVVFTGISNTNYLFAKNVEYGLKKYYWKVEAIGTSAFNKQTKLSSVATFTSATKEIVNKNDLSIEIQLSTTLSNNSKIGTDKGQFPKEAKDKLAVAIATATAVMGTSELTQDDIDNAIAELQTAKNDFASSMIAGNVDLGTIVKQQGSNWVAKNANDIRFPSKEKLVFKPTTAGAYVGGYNLVLPNYAIWTFKAKFDLSAGWQGFGIRASDPKVVAWSIQSYLIVIKKEQLELQRYNNGYKLIQIVPNTFIETGKEHLVEFGAVDIPSGGVHLIFKVDGKSVFDCNDTDGYIQKPGYFSMYSYSLKPLELSASGIDIIKSASDRFNEWE